jgi:acetyl esterase/lipase
MDHKKRNWTLIKAAKIKKIAPGLIICLTLLGACSAQETPAPTTTPKPKAVEVIKDQAYIPDGSENHLLDLYLPNTIEGPFPVLIMIHGGNSDKSDLIIWGQTFARKGYAAISINHRQWPDHSYPAHVEDAFCALAWIVNSAADYSLDPEQIVVMGHSAGGTLAAMLGVIDEPEDFLVNCPHPLPDNHSIKGVIAFTVIFDYLTAAAESPTLEEYTIDLLGGSHQEIPEIWQKASPANWVDGNDPPFLLIHGGNDQSISPDQSIQAVGILREAGVAADLLLIPNASHMQIKGSSQSMEAAENFLSDILN